MPIERVNGSRTSVYTGSFADDYRIMTTKDPESLPKHAATGAAISILANRISWFFNFQGPSVHLDSACSSSMMALDIACQGLRNGDANMALVAGSNTAWSLEPYLVLTNMGMISPDSRCYSFDDRANGYARGEGFGVLILKRLVDAVEDGDTIRAVIRSTGCNSDGRTPGITQPSKDAQETLIKETYAKAGLDLGQTRFFEAHGTGTAIGDPTEADAIGSAFAKYRSPDEPLYVGAVKSNIGHLEGASGVAGVIKAILALEKGVIPPNTNFERMNPRIDAPGLNLRFPTQPLPWPTPGLRRASINSFGFGGSNAHVVLDDAYNFLRLIGISGFHSTAQLPPSPEQLTPANRNSPPSPVEDAVLSDSAIVLGNDDSQPQILVWSAADEGGIKRISDVFNSHFKSHMVAAQDRTEYLSDLAYTLFERRSVLPWKSFAITHSLSELHSAGVSLSKAVRSSSKRTGLGFIFTGQGAQFAGMGRELLSYAVFKRTLQRAELYLHDMGCSWSLMDELLKAKNLSNINNPECSQSICTALQIALIELLRSFDITPNAVVGHSSGEIAAAYCMGGISFRSACKIAYFRGKLSKALAETSRAKGAMIAVGLSEAQVRPYILEVASKFGSAGIVVACINSPKSVTVSGDEGQVEALKMLLDEKSVFSRKLQVDVAYHSPHMEQVAADYQHALSQLETGETIPGCKIMLSSVTNVSVTKRDLCTPDYWVKNLTNPVRFSDAISKLVSGASNVRKKLGGSGGAGGSSNAETVTVYDLLELGPHSALAGPTKDILTTLPRGKEISYLSCLTRNVSAVDTTLSAAGRLWCLGYAVNIDAANRTEPAKFGYKRALTELPEYPFDHSQSYWHESRISKELRLREHSQLNLLGTRSLDWNPLDARWRKYVRLSETPWAQDHVVNGAVIYPAAGMLVMAIEGVRQMAAPGSNRSIKGYRIKEATFERALSIPSSADGAESQLSLRPIHNTLNDISKFEYIISTINDGIWAKNSQGIIQVEYQGDVNEVDDGFEDNFHMERSLELFQERQLNCTCHIESEAIYDHLGKMGLEFGPAFHTLSNVKCNEGEMTGEIKTFECEANSNTNDTQPHLIHPTTLDGFFQLVLIGMTRGTQDLMPATVPTRIDNLWLAPSGLCHSEAKFLRATSKHLTKGQRQDESSFLAMDDHHAVQVSVDILEFTRIDSQQADSSNKPQRRLCYNMDWKPDIELATPDQVQLYCNADRATDAATIAFSKDLESFCEATIFKLLPTIDSSKVDPARTPYLDWMKSRARAYSNEELVNTQLDNIASFDNLAGRLDSSAEGKFYIKVSRCLTEMLYGDISPFEVLVQSDIAKEYQTEIRSRLSAQLSKLVDLLAHKNPEISVLEVGAGAGDTTQCILDSLCLHGNQEGGTPRYSRYDFTDSSRTSLEKAQEKLQQYNSRVKYRLLDIENDVLSQGFVAGTYDLVIAAYSLCAAKDMDKALSNIRSLLKPNGKLVLLERTGRAAYATFALGLLPEWWQVADRYRCAGPTMTSIEWNQALENNGFSGLDVVINDYATPMCQEFSIIASTALEPAANDLLLPKSMILVPNDTGRAQQVAEIIQQKLHSMCSPACVVVTFDQAVILQDISERFCISLLEVDSPVLHKLGRHAFDSLKIVLGSISGLIWTTAGGGHSSGIPEYQTADGFLRSVRTENALLKAVTLALDPSNSEPKAIADAICKVLKGTLSRDISEVETEYMDQIDTLMIPRVVEANYMNDHIHKSADPQETLLQPFGAPNLPPLALDFEKPGLFDSLRFVEDTEASKPLKPYEVEIDVKAIGMNLTDCLAASGRIKRTDMGSECAGIVTRSGNESDFKIGDRVCGIVFGCFKSHARCDNRCLVRIPENLSFADAAALPMACTTVYQTLGVVGRLQQEDTVLIHAAAGGVGQIAIQFAQHLGAEIFATVGSQEKKKLIMDTYGIPSNHIFYSRDTTFAQGVMRMTNGRGVDVILNSLAGEGRAASWECMASFGRFVDIDKRDIHAKLKLDESQFARNVSYAAVDVFGMVRTRPGLIRGALLAAMDLVAEGKVRTSKPMRAYGVSQIEDAFRYMQSGRNIGKVVIDVKKDDIVQVSTIFAWLIVRRSLIFEPRLSLTADQATLLMPAELI